ncbi:hypothetical protein PYW08_009569 [Mythimna loreyi]|uniref:Uncharacterized protein n=1 Tax=Mythimna loreyi TaxID=667449 RepID=A0ACC2Q6U2_9NEOP|nr:hypothetical protein PYW08_009569 [Mythimna loreyi]
MAFFALLWKARIIENYRLRYEKEKINSIILGDAQLEQTLSQRWRHYSFDTKKRISRIFKKWYPDGSVVSNFFLYLMTDQTFPNFLLKSVMGFVGGIILTYLCFMFFVFQLAISLIHATIMSSIIGVLLTLGLAFSYRIRCLVFLLIPQFFSRVGRYTLTCYALVLILTGPATNTLKNSEVLSESMACSQEQIKTSVHQLNDLMKKPINAMKDSLKLMVDQLKTITAKVKETVIRLDRLVLSIVGVIKSSFSWLQSVADICNTELGSPYDRCCKSIQDGLTHCQQSFGPKVSPLCNVAHVARVACSSVQPFKAFCYATDFMDEAVSASVKKKIRDFSEYLSEMFHVEVHTQHSYSFSSNSSRSASQVAAGIVTEIRNRADPLLTWLSWSSCVTSLFLLLIIFRAKYYQNMYETRSRFDNRYVTKELQQLDLKRQQQGKETVLPLNRRERAKYITTSSFRLVASEKVYLNRSAVFMAITTFKLLIHMVADYSLYWVLMTIRCHGRYQSDMMPGIPHSGAHVSGNGFVQNMFSSIVGILDVPLTFPASAPISCLPDPYPPDLRRYTQIGVLIFLLWFFALFEPYGLRLRHLIMGHYRPERAKARATWLYNHILRTRGSFMKFARRKLHREYKYSSETSLTFRQWITDLVPFQCVRSLVGLGPARQHCLLCGITASCDEDSRLTKCQTPGCPGVFCASCFSDIGELCTICLSPADYGDMSDVSLEKGSSDDSDSDTGLNDGRVNENMTLYSITESDRSMKSTRSREYNRRWKFFTETVGPREPLDTITLSAFLAELEWTKRDYKKEEDIDDGKDSHMCAPASITANRIVGMVHLKNLPFQWREATKKHSATKLFVSLSKKKVYAKRAFDKFRHKVNTVPESPSVSLIQQMMNSFSGARCASPFNQESSICISKRESVFRSFGLCEPSDILDADKIFENAEYGAALGKKPERDKPSFPSILTEKSSNRSSIPGKKIVVSYSSTGENTRKEHCRCDLYDDLQRKWEHVKKSISEVPGTRNPLSMLKNFCSSLLGPSCNVDTCPNKMEKINSETEKKAKRPLKDTDCQKSISNKSAGCQTSNQKDRETQLTDEEEVEDAIRNADEKRNQRKMNKGMQIRMGPEQDMEPGPCRDPDNCDAAVQYGEEGGGKATKGVGSHRCLCDEGVQSTPYSKCTCATQHVGLKLSNMKHRDRTMAVHEVTTASPVSNKKTQLKGADMSDKATHCTARKHYKKGKEVQSGVSTLNQKLSLESNILLSCGRNEVQALKDEFTDTITDTSTSSISLRSDESKTDTTICSLATINYDGPQKRRKYRIKVITKANQSTLTDKTRVCDTGTDTLDWWSPMIERKPNGEILLEKKKKGLIVMEKERKELRELKLLKELKEVRKRRRNCGVTTDVRNVTFRSSTQIIPSDLFPGKDIMSPSRYLLESQRYYNELFAYNYRPRPQVCNYVTQMSRCHEKDKSRSPVGSRRNHHRKMKRLDECYSPKKQLSPRNRKTESMRASDSPRRKASHRHDPQSNNRHHTKGNTPRKRL